MAGFGDIRTNKVTGNTMQQFTESFGFIVVFLVLCLFVSMFFGQQVLFVFLLLILAGMLVVNWNKFENLLGRYVL